MEVAVVDHGSFGDAHIVSIRLGDTRRQAPLEKLRRHSLKFPASAEACAGPVKLEILQVIASSLLVLRPGEATYQVALTPANSRNDGTAPESTAALNLGLRVQHSNSAALGDDRGAAGGGVNVYGLAKYQDAAAAAREYLEKHGLLQYIQALLHAVIQIRPDDPYEFMMQQLGAAVRGSAKNNGQPSTDAAAPVVGSAPAEPTTAGGNATDAALAVVIDLQERTPPGDGGPSVQQRLASSAAMMNQKERSASWTGSLMHSLANIARTAKERSASWTGSLMHSLANIARTAKERSASWAGSLMHSHADIGGIAKDLSPLIVTSRIEAYGSLMRSLAHIGGVAKGLLPVIVTSFIVMLCIINDPRQIMHQAVVYVARFDYAILTPHRQLARWLVLIYSGPFMLHIKNFAAMMGPPDVLPNANMLSGHEYGGARSIFYIVAVFTQICIMVATAELWRRLFNMLRPNPNVRLSSIRSPFDNPNSLHALFGVWHISHHVVLLLIVLFSVDGSYVDKDSGLDWELWSAWVYTLIAVTNFTAIVTYGFSEDTRKSAVFDVMVTLCPGVGNDFQLAKEFVFAAVCFFNGTKASTLFEKVFSITIGISTIILSFNVVRDVYDDQVVLRNFIQSHWPIVLSEKIDNEKIDANSDIPLKTWMKKLMLQTTVAKEVQLRRQGMPQAFLEVCFLFLDGSDKFVWFALFTSIVRVFGIRVFRKIVAKKIEKGGSYRNLIPLWFKLNGSATDFSDGLSVFWMAVVHGFNDEAKRILESLNRPVQLDQVKQNRLIGDLLIGIPNSITDIEFASPDDVSHDCEYLLKLNMLNMKRSRRQCVVFAKGSSIDLAVPHISECSWICKLIFLDKCSVSKAAASQLSRMRSLTHLATGDSTEIGVDAWEILSKSISLTELKIGGSNGIGPDVLKHFANLSSLTALEIGDKNGIGSEGAGFLSNLTSLNRLAVGGANNIGVQGLVHLSKLNSLTDLEIGDENLFCSEGWEYLPKLSSLTKFKIGCTNRFDSKGAKYLSSLSFLTELKIGNFNDNGSEGANFSKNLSNLSSLTELEIGDENHIGPEGAEYLSNLMSLTRLAVGGANKIGEQGSEHLSKLSSLTELKIGNCNFIGSKGAKYLSHLGSLTELEIGDKNRIGSGGAEYLSNLTSLNRLAVGGANNIGVQGLVHLSKLNSLTELKIGHCNVIGSKGVEYLSNLISLTDLEIGDENNIGSEGAKYISKLTSLTGLAVGGWNEIMDTGVEHLSKLRYLTKLKVGSNNKISIEGEEYFLNFRSLTELEIGGDHNSPGAMHWKTLEENGTTVIRYGI
eukprot:TRINITY_DN11208_c0_g1_i3.p1 TRINITY_DN11208_c0_g1~~TRINITY_DN11208_c0_g1_i3.p1  ORF type:complete len:1305 (-),score=187.43 TRINITY_DN11208_c0_g1_i3:144-4058(-)